MNEPIELTYQPHKVFGDWVVRQGHDEAQTHSTRHSSLGDALGMVRILAEAEERSTLAASWPAVKEEEKDL